MSPRLGGAWGHLWGHGGGSWGCPWGQGFLGTPLRPEGGVLGTSVGLWGVLGTSLASEGVSEMSPRWGAEVGTSLVSPKPGVSQGCSQNTERSEGGLGTTPQCHRGPGRGPGVGVEPLTGRAGPAGPGGHSAGGPSAPAAPGSGRHGEGGAGPPPAPGGAPAAPAGGAGGDTRPLSPPRTSPVPLYPCTEPL